MMSQLHIRVCWWFIFPLFLPLKTNSPLFERFEELYVPSRSSLAFLFVISHGLVTEMLAQREQYKI